MEFITGQLESHIGQNYQSFNSAVLYLKQLLSCLGYTLVLCLDCSVGLLTGGVLGWAAGRSFGSIYKNCSVPRHFISFGLIEKWHNLPYEYSRYGIIAGAALGVLVILLITLQKSLKKQELEASQNEIATAMSM